MVEVIAGLGRGGAERALAQRLSHAPKHVETVVISTSSESSDLKLEIAQHAQIEDCRIGVSGSDGKHD